MSREKFIETISELDGRSDQQISSYYVETSALRRIREAKVPAVGMVGLKGAGKTTLFRLLSEKWIDEPGVIRVGLSPDRSEFEGYVERLNCLQFANSVRAGMAAFLAQLIDENIGLLPVQQQANLAPWLERKSHIFKPGAVAFDLLKRLRGLQILGCGLELGDPSERGDELKVRRIPEVESDEIWKLLSDFKQYGIKIRIVVDDPDRLFTHNGKGDPQLIAGYILGTNYLAKALGYVQFVHIIKSNVLEDLNSVEEMANLPHDYFDYISWSRDELAELVKLRLSFSGAEEGDIFVDPIRDAISVVADQIRNGPRDTLRYLEIILKSSLVAKVSIDTIAEASVPFRRAAKRQMEAVYTSLYEGIEAFLTAVFGSNAVLTFSEFRESFLRLRLSSQPSGVDYASDWLKSADRAFRALVEAGTVDVRTTDGWKRPYEAGYFLFDHGETATIRKNSVFA